MVGIANANENGANLDLRSSYTNSVDYKNRPCLIPSSTEYDDIDLASTPISKELINETGETEKYTVCVEHDVAQKTMLPVLQRR